MTNPIEAGKQNNAHMGNRGEAFISLLVLNEDNGRQERIEFLIDTGFNGYLQLQKTDVEKLDLKIEDKRSAQGFDGTTKEVGITKTKIKILNQDVWNFPIQVVDGGTRLIGTNLMKDTKMMLIIDPAKGLFSISFDKKVQKKVHKAVENYAK